MSEESRNGDCPEEKTSHGWRGCPGLVKDEEMLVRFFVDNLKFINKDGSFRPAALQVREFLAKGDGWSLYRHAYIDNMAEKLKQRAADKDGKDYGYVSVKAVHIRQIQDEMKRRAICVIDDPKKPDDFAHALARKARVYEEDEAREIRNDLIEIFRKFGEVVKSPAP